MALAAFDTLEIVDELEKAGIPEKQARAISLVVRKSHESSDVATKADLEKLGTTLRHEMKELELSLLTKLGGIVVAGVGFISTLLIVLKFFVH